MSQIPNLTPEGQRLADALAESSQVFNIDFERINPAAAVLFGEPAAALLLNALEREGAGLRVNQLALIMSAEASAEWFTKRLSDTSWRPNRADAEAGRNAIRTAAQAGRRLAALTKPPAAQEPAAAGVGPLRAIGPGMTPAQMERVAFNLSAQFGPDFVEAYKAFALAVYAEAYAMGRPAALTPAAPKTPDAGVGDREALDRIANPILYMQRETPEGYRFDGQMARSLVTVEYLQGIARDALAQPAPVGEDETGVREALPDAKAMARVIRYAYRIGASYTGRDAADAAADLILSIAPQPPKAETPAGVGEPLACRGCATPLTSEETEFLGDICNACETREHEHWQAAEDDHFDPIVGTRSPNPDAGATEWAPGMLARNARYEHDGVYPAFGETAFVQRVKRVHKAIYLGFGREGERTYLASLFDPAALSAAPAARPGDGVETLRSLSDVAAPGEWSVSGIRRRVDEASCVIIDAPSCPGLLALPTGKGAQALDALRDAKFAVAAVNFVRSQLAAAPAAGGGRA